MVSSVVHVVLVVLLASAGALAAASTVHGIRQRPSRREKESHLG
jgi:hypothetical protein